MSHVGLPVVRHDAYVMREWSACRAKSLSVTRYDLNLMTSSTRCKRDENMVMSCRRHPHAM